MQPRIIFLGTGAGTIVRGKQLRSTGGIVIQVGDNQLVLDPGPGTLAIMKYLGINVRETTALFVSHNHIGHCNDVNAIIDGLTYNGMDRFGVLVGNQTLINGTDTLYPYLTQHHRNCLEKYIVTETGKKIGINDIDVLATKCHHTDENTIGFKFMTPEFNLAYTSDTEFKKDILEYYKDADILIMNTVAPNKSKNNLTAQDAIKIIEEVKPKLSIITHFGMKMLEADPIYITREIQKTTGIQTIAAKDGMVINPISYSAKLRQRTLNLY